MPKKESSGVAAFIFNLLAPFILIFLGAAIAAVGFTLGWTPVVWMGLIVAGCGVVWGLFLLLLHGPIDWL